MTLNVISNQKLATSALIAVISVALLYTGAPPASAGQQREANKNRAAQETRQDQGKQEKSKQEKSKQNETKQNEAADVSATQVPEPTADEKKKASKDDKEAVRTLGSRDFNIKTREGEEGGVLWGGMTWAGGSVAIHGKLKDNNADGHCAAAFVWTNTRGRQHVGNACEEGRVKGIRLGQQANSALLKVCLLRYSRLSACSDWR